MAGRLLALVVISVVVGATFAPARKFALLNWDDQYVILDNAALREPGVAGWAFTTTYMEHYQPLSWLVWAGVRGAGEPEPRVFHLTNIALHILVSLLVWLVARQLFAAAARPGQGGQAPSSNVTAGIAEKAAVAAALLYAVHPLRVEVVAWVSAMPYALATALALASVLVWLQAGERSSSISWPAVGLFALSLLARPLAIGVPVVLVVIDRWRFGRTGRAAIVRAVPFALLALVAAGAEWRAREGGAAETPLLYRFESALSAPLVYLRHTAWPVDLTPLDVLPLEPLADPMRLGLAAIGLIGVTVAAWLYRRRGPGLLAAWIVYLALLAPAAGLVTSGLQSTADRYTYLPGIVLVVSVVSGARRWATRRSARSRVLGVSAVGLIVVFAVLSRDALTWWSDSRTLWTRVVALDPRNDVGHYNLAVTLAAAGDQDGAAERYRTVLTINPAHADARARLDRIDAARLEREANDLASRGRLAEAATRYQEALTRDPNRPHAHAARGMALATLGRSREAIPHLRQALRLGVDDVAIPNALAGLLMESGDVREARMVLEAALKVYPNDLNLAHNLARLLVTLPGLPQQDRMRAFRLAEAVAQATRGQDARALETLAASLAGIGRMSDAREFNARAAAVATAQGDRDLAVQITARGRAYR
jgi:tetratricopeptide (TPR) repeat protein